MCVLIYKPKGRPLPSNETLKACCYANPHGFGFVTMNGYRFRTMDEKKFIDKLYSKVTIEDEVMIHCRFATHGSKRVANCHPFKFNDVYFAHNGILNIKPYRDKTDSETAFISILYPVIEKYGIHSQELKKEVNNIIGGSKFCIFDTKLKVARIFGDYSLFEGCYYSNTRFMSYIRRTYEFCF